MDQPEHRPGEGPEALADAFLTASRVLVGLAVASLGSSPVEITVAQHRLLVLLAAEGDQAIGAIAEELGVNQSNASRHCDRLQRLDLVERRRSDEDGRVVLVVLTAEGRRVVEAVSAARRDEVAKVLGAMAPDDRAGMLAALRAFADAAHERTDAEWLTHVW